MATRRARTRPRTFGVRTENACVSVLYPSFSDELASLDAFTPVDVDPPGSENGPPLPEEPLAEDVVFTPDMANDAEGLTTVAGAPLRPEDVPYDPNSANGPEYPEIEEKYAYKAQPAPKTPEASAEAQEAAEGFPGTPRPNPSGPKPSDA